MTACHTNSSDMHNLSLLLSPSHECGYLDGQQAATLFADPMLEMDNTLYEFLLERGFRRSGGHVYRHYCSDCESCVAVRVPVNLFKPSRTFKRVWRRNQDLEVMVKTPTFSQERFDLYHRYLGSRHPGGPMENPNPNDFLEFLTASWAMSRFVEFRLKGVLVMVVVLDLLPSGMSAVYTFYDPHHASRSLGTYGILWQIREANGLEKKYLYLGYWIDKSQKMRYKVRFQPLQGYQNNQWLPIPPMPF